jgi:hypothetical protein
MNGICDLSSLRYVKAHKRQKSPQTLLLENIAISDMDTGSTPGMTHPCYPAPLSPRPKTRSPGFVNYAPSAIAM